MSKDNAVSLQEVLQFAFPIDTIITTGSLETMITWAVMVRAQPPAFPDIYGGELALVSLAILRSYDSRITLADVVQSLGEVGVSAIAVSDEITPDAIARATQYKISLLHLPEGANLPFVERAVNKLILNQEAQLTQRALDIQRQLTRLAAENRDLNSLLQVIANATATPVTLHDASGVLMAHVSPNLTRRAHSERLTDSLPTKAFQNWLKHTANPTSDNLMSPLGHTAILKVEKRVAGYLSLLNRQAHLSDFDRLVLTYGAEVCAIELAKTRAIASAVEQARGDWIQMWLSGTPSTDDLLGTRAQQAGFEPSAEYVAVVFRGYTPDGNALSLEPLVPLIRDDLARRNLNGAVGQYVDTIVALYPVVKLSTAKSNPLTEMIEAVRVQIAARLPQGRIMAGISRPTSGLELLRECYREAKDAINIAAALGDEETTTYYGDLKLYQLLLALKEHHLDPLRQFYEESLYGVVKHDEQKNSDLIHTLTGFFAANGNLAKAAADLDVHRNTLIYRLERISELTGLDLDDADNRLILHLALKIQRVLASLPNKTQNES